MTRRSSGGWDYIYETVKRIPRGRVVTYGQLAKLLRVPGGARTVGFAMAGCPSGRGIPWHRVVGAGGRLLPREPYASKQRMLLETEGTTFAGMKVDLAVHQWRAAKSKRSKASQPKQDAKRKSRRSMRDFAQSREL